MREFLPGYGLWILLAIIAMYLFAGACGRGGGMGCGGHGSQARRPGERRPMVRKVENEPEEENMEASRNGQRHHERGIAGACPRHPMHPLVGGKAQVHRGGHLSEEFGL
jgi:hypothetical protein